MNALLIKPFQKDRRLPVVGLFVVVLAAVLRLYALPGECLLGACLGVCMVGAVYVLTAWLMRSPWFGMLAALLLSASGYHVQASRGLGWSALKLPDVLAVTDGPMLLPLVVLGLLALAFFARRQRSTVLLVLQLACMLSAVSLALFSSAWLSVVLFPMLIITAVFGIRSVLGGLTRVVGVRRTRLALFVGVSVLTLALMIPGLRYAWAIIQSQ